MIIQFGLTIVLLGAFLLTWKRARQQAIRKSEACIWSVLWMGSVIMVWRPETSTQLAHWVGVGRGVDLIMYVSVTLLLILVFQLHVAHVRLERTLTELVRRQALQKFESTMSVASIQDES